MIVKLVTVFLKDQSGDLARLTGLLSDNIINIRALSLNDADGYSVLRLLVENPETAYSVLLANDYSVNISDVLALEVSDKPGGLAQVMQVFAANNISIEYLYAFVQKSVNAAIVVFQTDNVEQTGQILLANGFNLIGEDYISTL